MVKVETGDEYVMFLMPASSHNEINVDLFADAIRNPDKLQQAGCHKIKFAHYLEPSATEKYMSIRKEIFFKNRICADNIIYEATLKDGVAGILVYDKRSKGGIVKFVKTIQLE